MQARVLIRPMTDAMLCARGAREKCCRGSAVQVVNDVVTIGAQLPGNSRARGSAFSFQGDDVVHVWKSVEHGRHPVFQQNIDGRVRQKSF